MEYNDCETKIQKGMVIRILLSVIIISSMKKTKSKYLFLLLPLALTFLDFTDNTYTIPYLDKETQQKIKCTHSFSYQIQDKVIDWLTYAAIYILFGFGKIYFALLVWRAIGVILYFKTKKKTPVVIFSDFLKEYMVYIYFFGKKKNYKFLLFVFIILKMLFEYYFHFIRMPPH